VHKVTLEYVVTKVQEVSLVLRVLQVPKDLVALRLMVHKEK
jgi:hypothetical protein